MEQGIATSGRGDAENGGGGYYGGGGGGSSYVEPSATNISGTAGGNPKGDGSVTITW